MRFPVSIVADMRRERGFCDNIEPVAKPLTLRTKPALPAGEGTRRLSLFRPAAVPAPCQEPLPLQEKVSPLWRRALRQ